MPRYTVSILSLLVEPLLMPTLSRLLIAPIQRHDRNGITSMLLQCDSLIAESLSDLFFITDQEGNEC